MIDDSINEAPGLAHAEFSIAMESSEVVIVQTDLNKFLIATTSTAPS